MPCLLAFDQSTSATKALLCDLQGRVIDQASLPHQQHYPRPGWVEHDAGEIWRNVLAVARELLERNPARAARLAGISIANQRETIVAFERNGGEPVHRAIVWQCRRGDALCERQLAAGNGPAVAARTGLRIDGYFSASKMQWLMREVPGLASRAASGAVVLGTIDAFLVHRMTRGRVFATDATNASRTLLFDIRRLAWCEDLCRTWDVPPACLPEVRACDARFGETDLEGLLAHPVPLCGVMGDSQASLFAHRCFAPGSAKVTLGTGSSMLLNVGPALPASMAASLAALGWMRAGEPTYALEGLVNSSASTLAWLRDQLGLVQSLDELNALAAGVPSAEGVYLVPAFQGLGTPWWSSEARAAIVGLSGHSQKRHVARAALESIAFQLRDVADALRNESGLAIDSVLCDGGPTGNPLLMQLAADLAGMELQVAAYSDCSALGAAWMGMLGLGLLDGPERLPQAELVAGSYRPSASRADIESRYSGWQRAVRQVVHS